MNTIPSIPWLFTVDFTKAEPSKKGHISAPPYLKQQATLQPQSAQQEEPEYIKAWLESQEEYDIAVWMKADWYSHEDFLEVLEQYRGGVMSQEADVELWEGFVSETWEAFKQRWANLLEIQERFEAKNRAWSEAIKEAMKEGKPWRAFVESMKKSLWSLWTARQVVWQWFGTAWDVLWETVENAGQVLMPKDAEKAVAEAVQWIWDTETVQGIAESYMDFRERNPESARNIEATFNIASMIPWVKGTQVISRAAGRGWRITWEALEQSAKKTVMRKADEFAEELVSPVKNKKQVIDDISKWRVQEWGVFKGRTRKPTKWDIAIATEVKKIEGVWPWKTVLENNNLILDQIGKLDDDLISKIEANDVLIPKKETMSAIKRVKTRLADNPLLVWDAEKIAQKMINKFEAIVKDNPWKASGLLKSRRDFDAWIKTQKWTNVFDPKNESALTIALREIRTTANDLADTKAVNVDLKDTLKRQSNLFRAVEQTAPKARLEAWSAVWRLMQKVRKATGLKWELVTWLWLIWWGALATFAPVVAGLWAAWLWAAGIMRGLLSPATRKALWKTLQALDIAIQKWPSVELQLLREEVQELLDDNQE